MCICDVYKGIFCPHFSFFLFYFTRRGLANRISNVKSSETRIGKTCLLYDPYRRCVLPISVSNTRVIGDAGWQKNTSQ